jgi:hypothetical protein
MGDDSTCLQLVLQHREVGGVVPPAAGSGMLVINKAAHATSIACAALPGLPPFE